MGEFLGRYIFTLRQYLKTVLRHSDIISGQGNVQDIVRINFLFVYADTFSPASWRNMLGKTGRIAMMLRGNDCFIKYVPFILMVGLWVQMGNSLAAQHAHDPSSPPQTHSSSAVSGCKTC